MVIVMFSCCKFYPIWLPPCDGKYVVIESELERFKKSIYELAKVAMKAAEITSTQLGISISHLLEVINNGTC